VIRKKRKLDLRANRLNAIKSPIVLLFSVKVVN